jgi:hypothetical protein
VDGSAGDRLGWLGARHALLHRGHSPGQSDHSRAAAEDAAAVCRPTRTVAARRAAGAPLLGVAGAGLRRRVPDQLRDFRALPFARRSVPGACGGDALGNVHRARTVSALPARSDRADRDAHRSGFTVARPPGLGRAARIRSARRQAGCLLDSDRSCPRTGGVAHLLSRLEAHAGVDGGGGGAEFSRYGGAAQLDGARRERLGDPACGLRVALGGDPYHGAG